MATGATRKSGKPVRFASAARLGHSVLGIAGFAAVAVVLGFCARELSRLPIERVLVTGDLQRVSRSQLESMVNDSLQGGFLWVDLAYVREPLEQLPWIFRVVVKRRWPGSLEIQVTEQLPIARWGDDAYVNHEGEVFRPRQVQSMPELPLLYGPPNSQLRLMQNFMHMQEQLAAIKLQVTELNLDERGGLRARLSDGSELVFGRGDMEEKLARYLGVFHAELETRQAQVRSVDLRYKHGLAVAWNTG
jgi:cell division protein FtsQ